MKASVLDAISIISKYAYHYHRPAHRLKDIENLVDFAQNKNHVDVQKILDKYGIVLDEG